MISRKICDYDLRTQALQSNQTNIQNNQSDLFVKDYSKVKNVKDYSIQAIQAESTFCRKYIYMLTIRLPITYCMPLSQKGHVQARLLRLQLSVKKLALVLPELIEANKITEPMIASTQRYFQTDRKREIDAGLRQIFFCYITFIQ